MGGTVIVGATVVGYVAAAPVPLAGRPGWGFTATGLLLLFLMVGMGTVGFLDDYLKIRHRRSLGLNKTAKLVGQLVVGVAFAVLALNFPNGEDVTPASTDGLLRPRHRAVHAGRDRVRDPGLPVHRRVLQRGQPHRRSGRPGRGLVGDGLRLLRLHLLLAVHPRLRQRAHRGLLHHPRPARRHPGGRRRPGRVPRVPVVEHQPGADLHGRHRLPGPRRRCCPGWRSSRAPSCCSSSSAACSWRSPCRSSSRWRSSGRPGAGCSGWPRCTTTSSWPAGPRTP